MKSFFFKIILIVGFSLASPMLAIAASDLRIDKIDTIVFADGECDFQVNGQKLECDGKLVYTTYTNHEVAFTALPKVLGVVEFSGGKDVQPTLETYSLTVDRLILSGGTVVMADGFCYMDISKDGKRIHKLTCKALAHDGRRFEFNFKPAEKDVTVKHAEEIFGSKKETSYDNCETTIKLHGVVSRGSMVCDPSWLDRKGSVKLLNMARTCKLDDMETILKSGMLLFDNDAKKNGKDQACAKLDGVIKKLE
jgi:hypothetical protein